MKQQDGKPRFILVYAAGFPYFRGDIYLRTGALHLLRRSDISDGFASGICSRSAAHLALHERMIPVRNVAAHSPGVIGINYIFTFPTGNLNFTMTGYPLTFFVMLCVSLVTCTMTTKIKQQEQFRMESEREKMRANLLPLGLARHPHAADLHHRFNLGHSGNARPVSNSSISCSRMCAMTRSGWSAWWENLLSITRMGEDTDHQAA